MGELWEVNSQLLKDPTLVTRYPRTQGYIGVISPKRKDVKILQERLLTADEYKCLRGIGIEGEDGPASAGAAEEAAEPMEQ